MRESLEKPKNISKSLACKLPITTCKSEKLPKKHDVKRLITHGGALYGRGSAPKLNIQNFLLASLH